MVEYLETLYHLEKYGNMSKAGSALRVSQSAVSKRIARLEAELDRKLIEKIGRNVVLTEDGRRILHQARPLLGELRNILQLETESKMKELRVGFSESVLSSWGARILGQMDMDIDFHAHRSPFVVDRVRSGDYVAGVVAGKAVRAPDLQYQVVAREPMVLIPSGLKKKKNIFEDTSTDFFSIEKTSETWDAIGSKATRMGIRPTKYLEYFFSIANMAVQGLGHGLVPYGVVESLGIPMNKVYNFKLELSRPISLVARKAVMNSPELQEFAEAIRSRAKFK